MMFFCGKFFASSSVIFPSRRYSSTRE